MQLSQQILLRIFYFFNYGGLGAFNPFLPLLLQNRNLTPVQISWVMVLMPTMSIFVPPIWGRLSDRFHKHLLFLRISCVLTGLSILMFNVGSSFMTSALAMLVYSLFRAPITSIADAVVHSTIVGRASAFGATRVWGSIGFTLAAWLCGTFNLVSHPLGITGITSFGFITAGLLTFWISPPESRPSTLSTLGSDSVASPKTQTPFSAIAFLLIGTICYYAGHGMYDSFYSLHLKSRGFDPKFIGFAWASGVGFEVIALFLSPYLLRRVNPMHVVIACSVIASIRWQLIAIASTAWGFFACQLFHGITFGLWYVSHAQVVQEAASNDVRATMQSYFVSSVGIGMILGYLGGGQAFEHFSGTRAFQLASLAAGIAIVLYSISLRKRSQKYDGSTVKT